MIVSFCAVFGSLIFFVFGSFGIFGGLDSLIFFVFGSFGIFMGFGSLIFFLVSLELIIFICLSGVFSFFGELSILSGKTGGIKEFFIFNVLFLRILIGCPGSLSSFLISLELFKFICCSGVFSFFGEPIIFLILIFLVFCKDTIEGLGPCLTGSFITFVLRLYTPSLRSVGPR